MEKTKAATKGRVKIRALPPPGDFIALGSKSRTPASNDSEIKPLQPLQPRKSSLPTNSLSATSTSGSGHLKDKRKDIPGPLPPLLTQGLSKHGKSTPTLLSPVPGKSRDSPQQPRSMDVASPGASVNFIEAVPVDLENLVLNACDDDDNEQVDGLICMAFKTLKGNRLKPDPMIYLSLMTLVKTKPEHFRSKGVIEHLLMFLRRESTGTVVKPKPNPLLSVMACNILLHAFQSEDNWPESFVKAFVDDALGDRSWIDNEQCKSFVDNIVTAFGTVLPSKQTSTQSTAEKAKALLGSTVSLGSGGDSGGSSSQFSDEEKILEEFGITVTTDESPLVLPRYSLGNVETALQYYILDVVKDQLSKRSMIDGASRNMLRLLVSVCGYPDIRVLASQRIEAWLQNPKLTRPAQELLMSVAVNCNTHMSEDVEVIGNLIKMRLKPKPVANHYVGCMRELLNQHPENLGTTIKHVIFNELSQQRNPNNMAIIGIIFQMEPENAAKYLALVFQDLLTNREDYLRALRALFREIVRSLRYELNIVAFCRGLMQERTDTHFRELDQSIKERLFTSLVDLITMATLVSVSPTVKEMAMAKGERRDVSVYQEFQTQISVVQRDAIWWFHMKVDPLFGPSEKDYVHCLNKVLFLESNDSYQNKDNWPPESERALLLNLVREVPLTEDALLRLLILGLSEEFPINCADTLDIVDRLIQRAAVLKSGLTGLEIGRLDVIEMVLSLCVYVHPKEINLPQGYQPPTLAIGNLYWKGWTLLLILAACNPKTLGLSCWEAYPTLRSMMEIIITRNYTFPPLVTGDVSVEEIKSAELQLNRAEKEDILLFESHLAAATTGQSITESSSLLISQLISLDPGGTARQPPPQIMERLKVLNAKLGLGYMFCRSRDPDFLLDIIRSQGSSRSMPWLADLVESSEGSLSVLPAQCLCEFLLMKDGQWKQERKDGSSLDKRSIRLQVIKRLQALLKGSESSDQTTREVIEYFLNRLASAEMKERDTAVRALKAILNFSADKKSIGIQDVSSRREHALLSDLRPDAEEMEVEDEQEDVDIESNTYKAMFPDYAWLLIELPQLEFFETLLISVVYAIRQAVYVEMDVERLQAYIIFLSQHTSNVSKDELNELVEDISQLVTTRSTLLNGLIAHDSKRGTVAYKSLLQLYVSCLNQALGTGEFGYEWQHSDEKVYVTWSGETVHPDQTATLHVRVIHAAIVLLTCSSPQDENENYNLLLDTWFPDSGYYEVRLADTGEEAILLQDWLRMKMVTSNVPRLVDTGLLGLMPTQLVIFMQTFGLPVESMSKLLHCLDEAALQDPVGISQTSIDKDYMLQLVDVQWSRGATGGESFCSLLAQEPYINQQEIVCLEELEHSIELLSATHLPDITTQVKQVPEPDLSSYFDIENVKELLFKLYSDAKVSCDVMDEFMELKKRLSIESISTAVQKNDDISDSVLMALLQILQLDSDNNFMKAFFDKFALTCPLLEILSKTKCEFKQFLSVLSRNTIEGTEVAVFVEKLCEKLGLHKDIDSSASTLVAQVKRQLNKVVHNSEKTAINTAALSAVKILTIGVKTMKICPKDLDRTLIQEACQVIQEHNIPLFQKLLDVVCRCYIDVVSSRESVNFSNIKECVELLVDLYGDAKYCQNHMAQGLIVDWIEILDPEIVHVHPLLQRELLFLDRETVNGTGGLGTGDVDRSKTSTSYLAALLAHQSRGNTLHDCIEWLLSIDGTSTKLNPTAALDLINSVVKNPRLWQGRDSKQNTLDEDKGKSINDEVMLDITTPQLCKLAELILTEMETYSQPSKEHGEIVVTTRIKVDESRSAIPEIIQIADKRLQLLLNHVTNLNSKRMERVVSNIKKNKRYSKEVTDCFLQQLYLQRPNILGSHVKDILLGKSATITQGKECEADELLHRLMLSISDTQPGMAWQEKFQNVNLMFRRLAFRHPYLVLRQFPTFVSLLQGRQRMGTSEFKTTNQILFYTQMLSLMDLLRPHIFVKNTTIHDGLSKVIEVFLDLIQSRCLHGTDMAAIVSKLTDFLNQFVAYDSAGAFSVLSRHTVILEDLLNEFPTFVAIKFLCTFLKITNGEDNASGKVVSAPVVPTTTTPWTERQLVLFKQKLSQEQSVNDIMGVLNDVDETSRRRVDILQHFVAELISLQRSMFPEVRDRVHVLLLRHCRQQPRDTQHAVESYLNCLQSEDRDVAFSAAKCLPQLLLLSDGGCQELLEKMFDLSISVEPQVAPLLIQAIKNLGVDL